MPGPILALSLVGACATKSDVVVSKERDEDTEQVYPASSDQAWYITKAVFRWEGMDA